MGKFDEALNNIPLRGEVRSYHTYLQTLANLGCIEGLSDCEIINRIEHATLATGRSSARFREIEDAVDKARRTCIPWEDWKRSSNYSKIDRLSSYNPQRTAITSPDAFLKIAHAGQGITLEDLLEISDPKPTGTVNDWRIFLETLYEEDDILFLGDRTDKKLHTRDEWINIFETTGNIPSFFIINPLTGNEHMNQSGTLSYRCDAAVKTFRYVLIEFDGGENAQAYSLENQLAFMCKIDLPIVALTYSGSKSIHALVSLGDEIRSLNDWNREIKGVLYGRVLRGLGADAANSNPSRMSRLPGHMRESSNPQNELFKSTGSLQRLIYLNPEPKDKPPF